MKKGLLDRFVKRLLALQDTPERIARAFALGVFLSFSPFIGLHFLLGIGLALLCGLNRYALVLGLLINNPWTLVPIYGAGAYLGGLIVGFPQITALPSLNLRLIGDVDFWKQVAGQWQIIKPLVVGSLLLATVFSVLSYFGTLALIRQGSTHRS